VQLLAKAEVAVWIEAKGRYRNGGVSGGSTLVSDGETVRRLREGGGFSSGRQKMVRVAFSGNSRRARQLVVVKAIVFLMFAWVPRLVVRRCGDCFHASVVLVAVVWKGALDLETVTNQHRDHHTVIHSGMNRRASGESSSRPPRIRCRGAERAEELRTISISLARSILKGSPVTLEPLIAVAAAAKAFAFRLRLRFGSGGSCRRGGKSDTRNFGGSARNVP
jgi:hypothetical protein